MSVVVHINSWPGAGKLTIARHMAQLMGARVVDNHTLMNPALALFDRDDPNFAPARAAIRGAVLEQALLGAPNVPLIFTNALGQSAHDREVFTQIEAFAMQNYQPQQAAEAPAKPDRIGNAGALVAGVGQGGTFGFGDEDAGKKYQLVYKPGSVSRIA